MSWRVTVESLPGAPPIEATTVSVDATSWVVALRTARELLALPAPDPRELSVEVRDQLWRVADRAVGRIFVIEAIKPISMTMLAVSIAPAAPPDIVCELTANVPASKVQPFQYLEESLVTQRFESLEVARPWVKLRLAAWRNLKGPGADDWMVRLFAFAHPPADLDAEPVAYVEYRSWSGKIEILPPEELPSSAISGAHVVASPAAIAAALAVPTHGHASSLGAANSVQPPLDVGVATATPRPLKSSVSSSEDIIGSIFDSVHDVHFAPTVLDGADLLCDIAFLHIPCARAFVVFHDLNTAGWIVASGAGDGATAHLGERYGAADELFSRFTKTRSTLRLNRAEYTHSPPLAPPPTHVLMGVAALSGRTYGVIEVLRGADGMDFTEAQENALAYLADQFATFAASRGFVVREAELRARRS